MDCDGPVSLCGLVLSTQPNLSSETRFKLAERDHESDCMSWGGFSVISYKQSVSAPAQHPWIGIGRMHRGEPGSLHYTEGRQVLSDVRPH